MDRSGQVALVIGGTGALGAAIAARLASEGADVAFTWHRNADKAAALEKTIVAHGRRSHGAQVALDDAAAVGAFVGEVVSRFGGLDTLVYASGPAFELAFVAKVPPADWSRVIDADLKGCFHAVHAALPHLRARRGSIVAVTAAGVERAIARDILSLAPKAAITALMRAIALEEGRNGVRANCVAPGYIAGGIGQDIMDAVGPEMAATLVKAVPLRRMGTCEEIADAVAYLSSARAGYITGNTLFVSGGMEL
ncbi:beta-ketoacyl-ACP reductase [Novosphingobium sediminis]|uniref:Beta-ketoacyl-ACP reductase n=1 Tax=Novosphingobium sediminis TaxID=707214 RepID=A0A512APA8_9SPHN|nr:SDR family NAD(P)-dependent oxidoreductase [Novosphingobium sediminis]GEO01538.1 beta-ketoacyl-ACP reductase [Novosphingobium sediminis]